MDSDTEEKLLAQSLLSAAARHDNVAVRNLLRSVSANVQDDETGYTPLHAVIASCGAQAPLDEDTAADTVRLLFENGSIWNDLDKNNETPGCIAHRLGLGTIYKLVVDAGVRAELLLSRLDELGDATKQDEESSEEETENGGHEAEKTQSGTSIVKDEGAHAPALADSVDPPEDYIDHWDSNTDYLRSSLRFKDTQLLDSSSNAVMMDWETGIMQRHAELLLPSKGLRAMNIGHGMGIVDTAIQSHEPKEHHIVEAHPAVLAQMKKNGWYDKPGVVIHEGRWQDIIPKLILDGVLLDAIFYDTFAEDYRDLKFLFEECVIGLMDQNGRFGFYNGLGADRKVCYDVYENVVEMDLREAGLKTEWESIKVPEIEWKGIRRPYWNVDVYRLPTCMFL